jgi:hypothetical protein
VSISRRQFVILSALPAAAGYGDAQNVSAVELPPAERSAVETKVANILRKYGDRLNSEQRALVRRTVERHQRMLMRIRSFPLENSDPPATGFRA